MKKKGIQYDPKYTGESQAEFRKLSPEAMSRVLSAVAKDQTRERIEKSVKPDDPLRNG